MKSTKSAITGLTLKKEHFAQYLAKGYDNPTAYTKAFGAQTCSRTVLCAKALKVATSHAVVSYVEAIRAETRARGVIERDEIVGWLRDIALVGMERKQVRKVRTTKMKDTLEVVETEEIEYLEALVDSSGANSAIDKMIKMGGLYAAEKIETEHKVKGKFILNLKQRTDESV